MLIKGGLGSPPPPSLDIIIMQKIKAEQDRRIYRRVVTVVVLRYLAVFVLLLAAGLVLWLKAGRLGWSGFADGLSLAGLWIKDHIFIVVGGILVLVFTRIFKFGKA